MTATEIARKMVSLGEVGDAMNAYMLSLHEDGTEPAAQLEAAVYILRSGGDYRISYTCFRELYDKGYFRDDILSIMTDAFYKPNVRFIKKRYERNCKLLSRYKYIFCKDFPLFEELPIRFFPYDDNGYLPLYVKEQRFGDYVNFSETIISRNFFKDLEKPVLAADVYSQYELEYLNDNVRKSEDAGRENHIYLHYTDWETFCSYLQCLNLRTLLKDRKFVFLIEDEIEQYPIDFKARFGIDYAQNKPSPIGIREINRLIWHVQFSTHNGGDFFNEVFDGHPNLIAATSIFMKDVEQLVEEMKSLITNGTGDISWIPPDGDFEKIKHIILELSLLPNRTIKDIFVACFMFICDLRKLDRNSRIAPAIFFQPHFPNVIYEIRGTEDGHAMSYSEEIEKIKESPLFKGFKYIKAFVPVRRFTTSYAASIRYIYKRSLKPIEGELTYIVVDVLMQRILNRGYMYDRKERLYADSRLVRFEDSKLNPKATFTALASFLDLPYTESMTYCSENGRLNPHVETKGFDTASVYRTYDEFANDNERYFLEYFLRDAYEYFGYDFHYYDGKPMDIERAIELIKGFTTLNHYIEDTRTRAGLWNRRGMNPHTVIDEEQVKREQRPEILDILLRYHINRINASWLLLQDMEFVNCEGQPLSMMPKLELDPALLEQPLYH